MTKGDGLRIAPAVRISGVASVPGDKSISHRLAMMGAVAEGTTTIHNFAESVDCQHAGLPEWARSRNQTYRIDRDDRRSRFEGPRESAQACWMPGIPEQPSV